MTGNQLLAHKPGRFDYPRHAPGAGECAPFGCFVGRSGGMIIIRYHPRIFQRECAALQCIRRIGKVREVVSREKSPKWLMASKARLVRPLRVEAVEPFLVRLKAAEARKQTLAAQLRSIRVPDAMDRAKFLPMLQGKLADVGDSCTGIPPRPDKCCTSLSTGI